MLDLTAKRGLIFRICHINNLDWHIRNGLVCKNSILKNERFISIGNKDLIENRIKRRVPIHPFGTLSDYVPFYFAPSSVMMYNIKTGFNGIEKRQNSELIIFVSSIHKLIELEIPFVFTDRHAYLATANFYSKSEHLNNIDWKILQERDFKRDNEDLEKMERYQAEALVYNILPVAALLGVVCYNDD